MSMKIEVNGDGADPLWGYLQKKQAGILGTESIKWNFTKFLVDKNGAPIQRYGPNENPLSIETAIKIAIDADLGDPRGGN